MGDAAPLSFALARAERDVLLGEEPEVHLPTAGIERTRRRRARAWDRLGEIARLYPGLFAHWQFGVRP